MKLLGISGSLRKASFNSSLLRVAQSLAPVGVEVEIADISGIPLFNEDVQAASGYPPEVQRLREAIRAADALLFATPEYNYSMTGVLKNAIDWASRPPNQPFAGKPAGIIGASMAATGTARAQYHLRQTGVYLDMHFLNRPEVMVGAAHEKFDAQSELIHEPTREQLRKFMASLAALAQKFEAR
jgi:chromate reductase, NAD(P)H dehydrogenase (quinone)